MSRWSSVANTVARGLGYNAKAGRGPESDRPALFGTEPVYSTVVRLTDEDSRRENLAMNSAFFYSNITVLARKIGKPGFNVMKRVGEGTEHVYDHPLERLMRRPNPLFDRSALMGYSMAWLALDGNAYWYLTKPGDELLEIWPLPSREVKAIPHKTQVISHYEWRPGGKQMPPIPPDKIAHFRLVNPFSVLHGRGFVLALKYVLEGNTARMKWNADFFDKRRGVPEALLSVAPSTTQEDINRIRDEMEREHGGGKRRVAVGRAGEMDFQRFTLTHEEMDFLAGMKFDGELIDRVCGFPGGYWDAKANRSNAEQAERSLAGDTVEPLLNMFAGAIEVQIIDRHYEDGDDLTCGFDSAVPEDRELEVKEFQAYAPAMSYDEARAERGLPPVEGELGATPFVLMQALGQMVAGGFQTMPQVEAKTRRSRNNELADELTNWQKTTLLALTAGKEPRPFFSNIIPADVEDSIVAGLALANTSDEVRAVFEPWLRDGAWRGYP